jgi:imidazolonepropionase-like amidohydrolase
MSPLRCSLALVALLSFLPAQGQTLITGGKVLAPDGEAFVGGMALWIDGNRIRAIAPRDEIEVDGKCVVIDARGKFVIPGLIDLHTHLLLHPYDEASWNDQVLKESLGLRTIRATVAARKTLAAGFTTIRELGTEGAAFADVALRDSIAQGIIPGPRIFAATRALVATGCYGPSGFAPRFHLPKGAQEADGVDGVRKATREQIAAGADWIKFYADYRRQAGGPSTPTYSLAEMKAIVAEAKSARIPVSAHAVTEEGIVRAVQAGVKTIEHGYLLGEKSAAMMKRYQVVLCPTLTASESMARYAGWKRGQPEPLRIKAARRAFARALKSGITIACGSDAGVFAHGDNAREIELMANWGMGEKRALQAATLTAARVLRRETELGILAVGFLADIVILDKNPHQDITALRRIHTVIKNGTTFANK